MEKMIHHLRRSQQLSCDLDTAWNFFSSPDNLARITPKDLHFVVLTKFDKEGIYEGLTVDYTVTPLLGITLRWKTRITQVMNKKSFTDNQQKGPYKYWNHFHEFIPNGEGVLMRDSVDYDLPLGFIGEIFHWLVVRKKLQNIFDFRVKVLDELFNSPKKDI